MGYTTEFEGEFKLDKPLTEAQEKYLIKFAQTRRMERDADVVKTFADPVREAVNLPVGIDGEYFVGGTGFYGQGHDPSVLDNNEPPITQPGLWCQWIPNSERNAIQWDGGEKFYNYIEWLDYIIKKFIIPWGYTLNGKVNWQGENPEDIGQIIVRDNVVRTTRIIKEIIE
jgi:hypothetical protein